MLHGKTSAWWWWWVRYTGLKYIKPKRNIYGLNNKNLQFVQDFINENINDNIRKFNKKDIIIDVKI